MAMTSVRMPDELFSELEKAAEIARRSKGWIINEAVKEYLEKEAVKQERLEETHQALADLKAGRLHEGAAVLEWLDSWGDENEKTPPLA